MNSTSMLEQMTYEQRYLIHQAMADLDPQYDETAQLLVYSSGRHNVRESSHYLIGLLIRNAPGDVARACDIIERIIDNQYDLPDEIYHGTFKRAPQEPNPPCGSLPWKSFAPGFAYFLDTTLAQISAELSQGNKELERRFQAAVDHVLPTVWTTYDPNWREFIACDFAAVLAYFEELLPAELVRRMEASMVLAVRGSIDRRRSDAIPMNTNIELMHIFICDFYGHRLNNPAWIEHAHEEAQRFYESFVEFKSFAEFNSTTYYSVDLMALGLWRACGKSESIRAIGREVELGLWENIALFYNAEMANLSGPFTRGYEMEMTEHSMLGVIFFLVLGRGYEHLVVPNVESASDPLLALVGFQVPEHVKPYLLQHQGDRQVEKQFRELCERSKPGENTPLCTATAWIERDVMIGGMAGSLNTSGQLHPATLYWKTEAGKLYTMRLLRREPGGRWGAHYRGITYNAKAEKDQLSVQVQFDTPRELELFFEISGEQLDSAEITDSFWRLPGLNLEVEANAPSPVIVQRDGGLEIVYPYQPAAGTIGQMSFILKRVQT
ncbi:hypothetical protein [Paenibacillus cremeus]|uniref:Uncharacterized protein n=1 Tax=Paenibacillus cremeus TaxID=2163881 RepID=A0A559K4J5_9BACL|nr:hypothetical protein [Paenibacillus cremeus]TVY07062.1 hypothetical protein FPZ49_25665 [Paenibacillus cremeus]